MDGFSHGKMVEGSTGTSVNGVDDQHPLEKNDELGSGENKDLQDVVREKLPLERERGLVESSMEQDLVQAKPSSSNTGVKRKAETSTRASDAETTPKSTKASQKWYCSLCEVSATSEGVFNLHLQGKKHKAMATKSESSDCPMEKPVQLKKPASVTIMEQGKKWHCSLCQVSVTSETLLNSHLQGRKHKSKEAKLELSQNGHNMKRNSDQNSRGDEEQGQTNVKAEAQKKWYCSLCQISALSEKNLNDHLQGKKHKTKVEMLQFEISEADSNLTDKVSEFVENSREEDMKGGETTKKEQENSNVTPQVEHHHEIDHKMTDKSGLENDVEDVNSGQTQGNDQETSLKEKVDTNKLTGSRCCLKEEMESTVKYWHCQLCDEGTCDEATMASHRKSDEHMTLLYQKGGGVIVVSRMPQE